jgi:hypothetical protein
LKLVVAIGFAAFFVSSLAIGCRLLWLARRNRGLPELLIGLGILGIGPAGFALTIFAMLASAHPGLVLATLATAQLAISGGATSAYVFNWRVFRPESRLAPAVIGLAVAGFAVCFAGRWLHGGYTLPMRLDSWMLATTVNVILCMWWGAFESLRYYALMRRRVRLGLADPVVANRFLLWGIGIGAAGVGSAVGSILMLLKGNAVRELDASTLSNSLFGLLSAVSMWVAFLPPAAWRRWLQARSAEPLPR